MSVENYDKEYYERCKAKGIDYAYYGNWQLNYARLIVFMCDLYMMEHRHKSMLDIGCACGVNLKAFKETKIFDEYFGIDISEYLIKLGQEKVFKDNEHELIVASSLEIPFSDNYFDFIHCSQLFEHMFEDEINATIQEIYRVMKKGAVAFITLNSIKKGQTKDDVYKQDPSHVIAQKEDWWGKKFLNSFEILEGTEYKWRKGQFYPGNESDIDPKKEGRNKRRTFYDHYKNDWSVFILQKRN